MTSADVSKFVELGQVILDRLSKPRLLAWWYDVWHLLERLDEVRRKLRLPHWLPEFDANHEAIRAKLLNGHACYDYRSRVDRWWRPGKPCDPDCFRVSYRRIPWNVLLSEDHSLTQAKVVCRVPVPSIDLTELERERYSHILTEGDLGTLVVSFVFSDPYQSRDAAASFALVRKPIDLLLAEHDVSISDVHALDDALDKLHEERTLGRFEDVFFPECRDDAIHYITDWLSYVQSRASLKMDTERSDLSSVRADAVETLNGQWLPTDEFTEEDRPTGEWADILGCSASTFRNRMTNEAPGETWRIVESKPKRYRVHRDDLRKPLKTKVARDAALLKARTTDAQATNARTTDAQSDGQL